MKSQEPAAEKVPDGQTVVCSPHFDDAVLNCWSVLERDASCAVVNVFTGAPGGGVVSFHDRRKGMSSSAEQVQLRSREDAEALSLAGKTAINLGMLEVTYRLRHNPVLHTGPLPALAGALRRMPRLRSALLSLPFWRRTFYATPAPEPERLADSLAQAVPGASTFWVPAGIGGHRDHLLVRQAGAVLASRGMNVRLYADLPYAVIHGWPQWIRSPEGERPKDEASALWERHLDGLRGQVGEPIRHARVVQLSPEERTRKAEAVRRYASQIATIQADFALGGLDEDSAFAHEVYWELPTHSRGKAPASTKPLV
jgi:hypothetical protein